MASTRKSAQATASAVPEAAQQGAPEAVALNGAAASVPGSAGNPKVKWNTEHIKSSYINFANANSTREEVVLNFGTNSSWDRAQAEVEIELAHRIVMNPHSAKRLAELLARLMAEYEKRYGELK